MAEAIGRDGKFDGDVRIGTIMFAEMAIFRPINEPAIAKNIIQQRLPDQSAQIVVHDHPLVMPGNHPPRLFKKMARINTGCIKMIENLVVETDHAQLQLRDYPVFIVARITDDRPIVRRTQQIVCLEGGCARHIGTGEQLRSVELGLIVEIHERRAFRPVTVDTIQVQRRRPEIGCRFRSVQSCKAAG